MGGYLSAPLTEKRASPNRFFHMGIASRISKSARERNRSHVFAGHPVVDWPLKTQIYTCA